MARNTLRIKLKEDFSSAVSRVLIDGLSRQYESITLPSHEFIKGNADMIGPRAGILGRIQLSLHMNRANEAGYMDEKAPYLFVQIAEHQTEDYKRLLTHELGEAIDDVTEIEGSSNMEILKNTVSAAP